MNLLDLSKKLVGFANLIVTPSFTFAALCSVSFGLTGFLIGSVFIVAETYINIKEKSV